MKKIKELFKDEPKPNIDFQDTRSGDTPLHIAIRKEKLQVIKLLTRNKARIDIKNNRGKTSLDIAQSLKRRDIVQLLETGYIDSNVQALIKDRRKSIDSRGLLIAAAQRNQKEVERLIKEGVNVDFVDAKGNIALHYAVSGGDLSIVQLLLSKVKNANTANNGGETPLDIAECLGKKDIVQALKAQQLSVGAQSSTQQQSQQKRARVDSEENKLEDSNSKKLRTSSSDHQSMEVNQDISRKRIHFQDDRESSVVLEAESNVATSSNHQNVEFGNISSKKRVRFQSNQEDIGALNIRQSTSFLDKPNKYAASGVKNSLHGCIYQLKLLMLFLKRGLDKGYSFRLATEMDAAEKFDDLVFEYKREGGGLAYRFLQAKHKQDEKSIEVRDLLTEDQDGEFRLAKYFVSYRKIIKKPEFNGENDEIQDFIICTNAGLSNDLQDSFEQIAAQDDLLDVSSGSKYPKRLKLKIEKFPVAALKDASDINRLAKRLIECAIGNKDIGLKDGLFKEYHTALASEVINIKDKKFKTSFINNDNLSEKAQKFREVLLAKGNLFQKDFEIKMKDINLKLSSTFGKGFRLDDSPRVTNPREFSEAIVNAIENANNSIVSIKRESSKAGIIKDNINKLAGYVLIEKDDGEANTYYFSPTFFDDSHKLPGNLEAFKSELKAELKNRNIDFDKEKYKFRIANFQTCKEGQLHTKFELPDDHVTEAEIESFFEKLIFAVNQPNEIELGKILEAKISREFSEKFNYIGSISRDAYNKFQIEVLNWMKEKEGRFLSDEEVKEFFMETEQQISTISIIEKVVREINGKVDGVEKTVESNNKILKEVHSIVAEKSNQQTYGSIWFDMVYPVQSFTGRTSELETLHDALEDRQVAIPQMVSIAGLGGVGKSELARKYAYSHSKDYDNNVIWVNAGTQETLKESFQELAKNKLRIPTMDANGEEKDIEDIIIDAYNYFKSVKSLFIFDDAKSYEDVKEFLPFNLSPDNKKPYVLITSCSKEWKTEEGVEIQVKVLSDFSLPEAMQFIKGTLGIDNGLQDDVVENLAEVLQCFPLALQEAVWCITSRRRSGESLSIEDYIKEYKRTESPDSEGGRNGKLFATLRITLKNIKQNGNYGKKALEILNIMAYLAPGSLPLEIFSLTLTEDQKELTRKAVDLLCQYSVINVDGAVSRIHGLVQEVIKVELKEKKGEEEVLKQTFKLLERTFSDNTRNIYTVDHLLVEHLRVFCSHIYHWSKDGVNKKSIEKSYLKNLLIWRAKVYGRFGAFERKKELLNEALSIDPEDAITRAELGVAYEYLSDYEKQKEYLEQALGIFKKNHDQNGLQVAVVEAKLGKAYGNLKQYEEQKRYLEQSIDVFEKNHNRNDLQIATIKVELGKAYGNLGEYRKQEKYLEEALGVFEKCDLSASSESLKYSSFWRYPAFLGVHYSLNYELLEGYTSFSFLQVIDVKVELSAACENLGEYQKQKEYLEQVLSSLEELRVRDDFRVAIMKVGLGRAYGNLEQYEEQKEHLKQALDIFDKRRAEEFDPFQVAVTKLNLGRAYSHLNIHNKQKKCLEQALDIYRNHGIDDVQVAITKAELGKACQENSLERKHYLKQALDVLEEFYDYDDREAIEGLEKELYKDKPQLDEKGKLTAYEKQKRRLVRIIRTLEKDYSESSSQASSGSVEPDETVKNSLKYNKFQYAIVLRDLAKVLRDSNMKTSKKDRYARYIMLLQEAKGIFKEYYGANHFYVATVLIRLSLYNNEINHMLQQMNVYHKNDESKNDLRSALNIFEKHYNDNYFRVNAEKLVKVSYPNSIHQESEVLAGECLPSISRNRKKREVESECLFTWEDVDEFNVEKDEKRDFNKIEIDSKKFVNYIKGLPEEKRSQLIELADKVKVTGKSQGLIYKLTNNRKVMNHLSRIGKISGMTMHGMMAKNVLADFVNGDYQGVAINVGFIAGGQGFARVAEAASLKGLKLAAEGKFLLGRPLKAASPFLARGTSAFVIYDLVNQVKEFKNGTEEALVSIVGDSIYLGVDAAEIGIEVAEAFEILEGVSSVTGPIGAAIGAVVFVGTDIYMAVKRVDKIDQIIHLKGNEKFIEGLRAFIGMQPEQSIEELLEEKQLYNQLVNQGLEYLQQHSDIKRYVFPSGRTVKDSCLNIPYDTTECVRTLGLDGGRCLEKRIVTKYYYKCTSKFEADLDNEVFLDRETHEIKWSRARPNDPSGGKVFCLPQGDYEPAPSYGSYLCKNAIGITDLSPNKTEGYTLINLGEGRDYAKGFLNSPNIFVVNNGSKRYFGGDKDDIFILQGGSITGYFYGESGVNTLDLTSFAPEEGSIDVKLHIGQVEDYYRENFFGMSGINKFLGRKDKADQVFITCDSDTSDIKFVDGQSGSEGFVDHINIYDKDCAYEMQVVVRPNTVIYNRALKGDFHYIIPYALGSAKVDFVYTAEALNLNNTFAFEYEPAQIKNIDARNINVLNKTSHIITFNFAPMSDKEFNITISGASNPSYRLGNNAEIKVGNNGNLYMLENTNKSVDEIIKEYLVVANRLNKMSFFIQSLLSNETVVIGSGNHEVMHNNPLHKSHMVGNGGENVYVIDSETDNVLEVIIHDVDEENSIDTIDLRNVVKKAKGNFELQVIKSENDLLLRATVEKHEYFTVRLKDGVDRYNKAHVIVENVPMRISVDKDEWSLKPQPLMFDKDKEVIVIADQDVEKGIELITPRKGGNYTFVRSNSNDLMITNAFDFSITKNDLCSITLSRFYETPKMATLSIKFADKEVVLKDHQEEISTARDVNVVKKEHKDQVYNDVFNHAKSSPEVMVSGQPKLMHKHRHEHSRKQIRHRRHHRGEQNLSHAVGELGNQANIAVSNSAKKLSSRINDLFGWMKSFTGKLFYSQAALPEEELNTKNLISQLMDVDGTIMLLDVLVRKVTGQKYISTADQYISPLEAQGCALNITKGFEKIVEQAGLKSAISMHRLNIDYMEMQKEITRKVMSGKFNEISGILKSYVEKACPDKEAGKLSPKKFDKFIAQFNKGLLNQSIERILHNRDGRLEVDDTKQMSLEPQSYLSNASRSQPFRSINLSF